MDELFDYDIRTPPGGQPPNFQLFINPTTPSTPSSLPSPFPSSSNMNIVVNKVQQPSSKKTKVRGFGRNGRYSFSFK